MKTNFLITFFLLVGLWSCNNDQIFLNAEAEMPIVEATMNPQTAGLKSGAVGILNLCEIVDIPLLHKEKAVGTMRVMQNNNYLVVQFYGDQGHEIEQVQLWTGTDIAELPLNSMGKPVPGKFPFKTTGPNDFNFLIPEDWIADDYVLNDGNPLLLAAHVETVSLETGESESAWSEGTIVNEASNATYSIYQPCISSSVGGGCFPFPATCGLLMDDDFFFDITKDIQQRIVAKIGKNNFLDIGTVIFDSGFFYFDFDQDWYFTDLYKPELVITGYKSPGKNGKIIFSGAPLPQNPPRFLYHGPAGDFNYYKIELQVQYCY